MVVNWVVNWDICIDNCETVVTCVLWVNALETAVLALVLMEATDIPSTVAAAGGPLF